MAGIDYGMGKTNIDSETGIRYGCISQHSVMPEVLDEMEFYYGEPDTQPECPYCGTEWSEPEDEVSGEVHDMPITWGDELTCPKCGEDFEVELPYFAEPISMYYDEPDIQVCSCLDSDLMITKSPYFTYADYCSPCVPGAGNLDAPCDDGVKCYCLGHDWFDDEAPYPVYRVDTGELVKE